MALDRLLPVSTTPGAVTGDNYMDEVQEEVTGLWDRARIKLTGVSGTDTITGTFVPALTAGLVDGMNVLLRAVATNTGAVTLNGDPVKDALGNALGAGAIQAGGIYDLIWVSAASAWFIAGYNPAVLGGLRLIQSFQAGGSSSIDFTSGFDDSVYKHFVIKLGRVQPVTDDVELRMRVGNGSFATANYRHAWGIQRSAGSIANGGSNSDAYIPMSDTAATQAVGNGATEELAGEVIIAQVSIANVMIGFKVTYGAAVTGVNHMAGGGCWDSGSSIDRIQFFFESGNINRGFFGLYGYTF